nr:MAG TPA: hypothetical protein [Caudoviricetes sp.]
MQILIHTKSQTRVNLASKGACILPTSKNHYK